MLRSLIIVHTVRTMAKSEGGVPVSIHGLVTALARKYRHSHFVLLFGQTDDSIPVEELENLTCIPTEYKTNRMLNKGFGQAFSEFIKKGQLIVHDHGIWNPVNHFVASYCIKQKIPRIITPHGLMEPWAMNYRKWKKTIAWGLYQRSDYFTASAVHTTSAIEEQNLKSRYNHPVIRRIPWGVSPEPKVKSERKSNQLLFLSRIQRKKGLIELIEAWNILRPGNWKIIVAGPDEQNHKEECLQMIKKYKLEKCFDFVGEVHGIRKNKLYAESNIYILPSKSENFGFTIAEALLQETPVITTYATPWKDILDYDCGWYCGTDLPSLVDSLREAMNTPARRLEEMGKKGREMILKNYGWENCASEMMKLYESVL